MKKVLTFIGSLAVVGAIISATAANQKQPAATTVQPNVEQLTQQIDKLQSKIKSLEERLAQLEKERTLKLSMPTPRIVIPSPNTPSIPLFNADPNRPPNATGHLDFNGLRYYMLPIDAKDN